MPNKNKYAKIVENLTKKKSYVIRNIRSGRKTGIPNTNTGKLLSSLYRGMMCLAAVSLNNKRKQKTATA